MYYVRRNNKFLFLGADFISLFIAYLVSFDFSYSSKLTLYFFAVLGLLSLVLATMSEDYWTIAERGYLSEIKSTFLYVFKLVSMFTLYIAVLHRNDFIGAVRSFRLPAFIILLFILTYITRCIAKKINKKYVDDSRRIIILSEFSHLNDIGELPSNYKVIAYANNEQVDVYNSLPVIHNDDEIRNFLAKNRVDEIYANISSSTGLRDILKIFEVLGIPTKINITPLLSETTGNTIVTFQGDNIYLTSAIKIATLRQMILKRFMDITLSLAGIVLMVIVGIVIFPIVKKQAPGPLIFTQTRVGQNGKKFKIYKFRSMYMDAEERKKELMSKNELSTDLMFKMDDDPRIFPFGHKIRAWSLDELPQFINVLKGEMSVVGTRPPTYEEYKKYDLHHFKRMQVKPGITGMWQVSGRSNILDFEEVVKLDMKYIENWSLRLDIKIIVRTIAVVLKREGSK